MAQTEIIDLSDDDLDVSDEEPPVKVIVAPSIPAREVMSLHRIAA
jgi:hypothetical protein